MQYMVGIAFPLDNDGTYTLLSQLNGADELLGISLLFRYRARMENSGVQPFVAVGAKYSKYSFEGYSAKINYDITIDNTAQYGVLQLGISLLRDMLDLVIEYPFAVPVLTNTFEGTTYTASPAGAMFGLNFSF
jgi:hypothetical protein